MSLNDWSKRIIGHGIGEVVVGSIFVVLMGGMVWAMVSLGRGMVSEPLAKRCAWDGKYFCDTNDIDCLDQYVRTCLGE